MTDRVIFGRDELDLVAAFAGCSLNEKPGKNWVERSGGLPEYICRIARAVKRDGKTTSQAIAIAVARVKKWAAGGDDVDADTRAKAAKALAEWEKLKGKNAAKKTVKASNTDPDVLCLAAAVDYNVDMVRQAFDTKCRDARRDWRAANPNNYDDGPPYWYIKEQWSRYLIVKDDYSSDNLFKVPYTVDKELNVDFGDPVQVKTQYVVVEPATDLGDTLTDAALQTLLATDTAAGTVLALARRTG